MKTLEQSTTSDQSPPETTISFPTEIIQEILTRLPVKSILQFRSISKPVLSLINTPIFTKLHFTRATANNRTALFISAYDTSTRLHHFLSATHDGGLVTHLLTLHNAPSTEAEHLNGLVLVTSINGFDGNNFAFVLNPATRKVYKLSGLASVSYYPLGKVHICYFFGFDESKNEHKVLNISMLDIKSIMPFEPSTTDIMIFDFSSYSWRKIDVKLPIDISGGHWYPGTKSSVCVNSVIHLMLRNPIEILAFDLRTEKFSIINIPQEALPLEPGTSYTRNGAMYWKSNDPFLMKVNGLLGVVCHDRVVECNEMCIWILQDYENRVWVRKTITFSTSWIESGDPFPLDSVKDGIVFRPKRLSGNMISVPIYDLKTGSFKSVNYFLGHQFLRSKTVNFCKVRSYVESVLPLERNEP